MKEKLAESSGAEGGDIDGHPREGEFIASKAPASPEGSNA
jgi:hypothetical protein